MSLKLPAIKRSPASNDIVMSEFFVQPNTKDSTQFAFVEFYNGSTDTLVLDKCTFGKTSNVSGSAEIETFELPPNEVLVVGDREDAQSAGIYKFTENMPAFGKTSGSIVFVHLGMLIDDGFL